MRLLTKILSFLMLLVLLTAEDCGNNSVVVTKEDRLTGVFQNIEDDFGNNELSEVALSAFEKRAIQKLEDISDYINIYADTSISVQFRKQANQMIREIFSEKDDVTIFYKNIEIVEDTANSVLNYIKYGVSFKTEFSSFEIIKHFQKESDLKYTGEIKFTQRISFLNQTDTVVTSFPKRINMLAIKTKKNFGSEIQDVWEVYLGENNH